MASTGHGRRGVAVEQPGQPEAAPRWCRPAPPAPPAGRGHHQHRRGAAERAVQQLPGSRHQGPVQDQVERAGPGPVEADVDDLEHGQGPEREPEDGGHRPPRPVGQDEQQRPTERPAPPARRRTIRGPSGSVGPAAAARRAAPPGRSGRRGPSASVDLAQPPPFRLRRAVLPRRRSTGAPRVRKRSAYLAAQGCAAQAGRSPEGGRRCTAAGDPGQRWPAWDGATRLRSPIPPASEPRSWADTRPYVLSVPGSR